MHQAQLRLLHLASTPQARLKMPPHPGYRVSRKGTLGGVGWQACFSTPQLNVPEPSKKTPILRDRKEEVFFLLPGARRPLSQCFSVQECWQGY